MRRQFTSFSSRLRVTLWFSLVTCACFSNSQLSAQVEAKLCMEDVTAQSGECVEAKALLTCDSPTEGFVTAVKHDPAAVTLDSITIRGTVTETNQWGKRKFAYPIKKQTEGNYVFEKVQIKQTALKELDANLKLSEDVLRYLFVRENS